MNAHQRRKFMTWKHSRLPLGLEVVVQDRPAKISKHDSQSPHLCIVDFTDGKTDEHGRAHAWVPIKQVKPVTKVKVRPWYRVMWGKARSNRKGSPS